LRTLFHFQTGCLWVRHTVTSMDSNRVSFFSCTPASFDLSLPEDYLHSTCSYAICYHFQVHFLYQGQWCRKYCHLVSLFFPVRLGCILSRFLDKFLIFTTSCSFEKLLGFFKCFAKSGTTRIWRNESSNNYHEE